MGILALFFPRDEGDGVPLCFFFSIRVYILSTVLCNFFFHQGTEDHHTNVLPLMSLRITFSTSLGHNDCLHLLRRFHRGELYMPLHLLFPLAVEGRGLVLSVRELEKGLLIGEDR